MDNKEEPMKPDRYWFNKYLFKCRRCGKVLDILEHTYCPGCGQKIDWSEYPADEPEMASSTKEEVLKQVYDYMHDREEQNAKPIWFCVLNKPPTESATDWDGVECE